MRAAACSCARRERKPSEKGSRRGQPGAGGGGVRRQFQVCLVGKLKGRMRAENSGQFLREKIKSEKCSTCLPVTQTDRQTDSRQHGPTAPACTRMQVCALTPAAHAQTHRSHGGAYGMHLRPPSDFTHSGFGSIPTAGVDGGTGGLWALSPPPSPTSKALLWLRPTSPQGG